MVEQAFGLPNTHFVNTLLHVSPGHDVQDKQATEEGLGGEEKALVKKRDFNSFQKSPKWIDPFMVSIKYLWPFILAVMTSQYSYIQLLVCKNILSNILLQDPVL